MNNEYPIDCETCGCQIVDEEDDFNGICSECYNTPLSNLK